MKIKMQKSIFLILLLLCISCADESAEIISVTVSNPLDISRSFETVEIDISDVDLNENSLEVVDVETKEVIISQIVDYSPIGDVNKVLLFQPEIAANGKSTFKINLIEKKEIDSSLIRCYSRFVPERTDDYAWENNRVAFRTFGPVAQKMVEDGVKGGTLTSGIDAWLKRVEYPIINKWYERGVIEKGAYHKDIGEGLDNFHVGVSRGVGGIAVKTDSSYAVSKNFTTWKTITTGPIRTSFILDYEDWDAKGNVISEKKHISLDYGQNLTRYYIKLKGTDKVSVGLTSHKKDGEVSTDKDEGWMSYWEPFDDSELGQGVVMANPEGITAFNNYLTDKKDESNLYVQSNISGFIEYYAGFGWKKSGQFESKEDWNKYLALFSKCLENPLQVTVLQSSN
ncbi:DUF4861 family protein [Nonlabens ulvanivorans]|uniref:Uncharacterized protein DUF4861 n=1 Tax=Nonlabens ulvanivorans TaxID=906888 RepID=A0A084JZD3_NONUL|nr:DUF4861 family protein [Nonlabens ulvanivorans]KEZ94317.1 hypothetical protein IL45_01430 [Nonlabens ulvanivorans]PRX11974.1 uncharacterized protein DUF4861 [Nonlabens ulvanivorans]